MQSQALGSMYPPTSVLLVSVVIHFIVMILSMEQSFIDLADVKVDRTDVENFTYMLWLPEYDAKKYQLQKIFGAYERITIVIRIMIIHIFWLYTCKQHQSDKHLVWTPNLLSMLQHAISFT